MPCSCESYECIDVFLVECAENVTLPLEADESGTWKMIYDFNGVPIRTDLTVTEGSNIVAPASVFNENYTHVVKFYKTDNSIFNDTCYKLNIMPTVFTNPAADTELSHITVTWLADGTTHTDSRLEGRTVASIDYMGTVYNESLVVAGTTLTSGQSIPADTKVTIHFLT